MNVMQSVAGTAAVSADPEVTPKAKRRSFSAAYKKKILSEVDGAAGTGNIGEILRREGIYSSTLTGWRKEREAAVDTAFSQKRGPEPKHNPLAAENEKLRRRNQRLEEELRKAEIIIDVQKKVAMLLGRPMPPVPENGNSNGRCRGTQFRGGNEACVPGSCRSEIGCLPAP